MKQNNSKNCWRIKQQEKHKAYVLGNIKRIFQYAKRKEYDKEKLDQKLDTAKQTQSYHNLKNYNKKYVDGYIKAKYETHLELLHVDKYMGSRVYLSGNMFYKIKETV